MEMDVILRQLDRIEQKMESQHTDFSDKVSRIAETQAQHTVILDRVEKDLYEHKEGVIQNRTHIQHLEDTVKNQDNLISQAVETYKNEVKPVVEHVDWMRNLPTNIKNWVISASKVLGAIAVIVTSIATIAAYFAGWLD